MYEYLIYTCETFEIVDKIQLNTGVKECKWLASENLWEVTLQHVRPGYGDLSHHDRMEILEKEGAATCILSEEVIRSKVVLSAVGGLFEPNLLSTTLPGLEHFRGPVFHSSRWPKDLDLQGKDVVLLGTGSSAVQIMPQLRTTCGAKTVVHGMRSAPWVMPRGNPFKSPNMERMVQLCTRMIPGFNRLVRVYLAAEAEYDFRLFGGSNYAAVERAKFESPLVAHIKAKVPLKYQTMLTPSYPIGCKRRVLDSDGGWFDSLHDPSVQLTNRPIKSVSAKSITFGALKHVEDALSSTSDLDGTLTVAADAIIVANGFRTTEWFQPLHIIGSTGKTMQETFDSRGGAQMYMGTALDEFPNFFAIYGPNTTTGHTSLLIAIENMVMLAGQMIAPVLQDKCLTVEVKHSAAQEWAADTQAELQRGVWTTGGCSNFYLDKNGRNTVVYP